MNFSTDRDLLALEPTLFNDIAFASQTRLEIADGVVSGTTLTSATASFETAQIEAGDVLLIAAAPCEVIARVNATTLTVSRLRGELSDAAIPPNAGSSLTIIHRTFEPQARLAHDEILRSLGIDPQGDGPLTEDAIVSLSLMRDIEILASLARVYEAALAQGNEENITLFRAKAAHYRLALGAASRRGILSLDLDGDGVADTFRDLGVVQLIRE